jgi:signal transduction histidine kinase
MLHLEADRLIVIALCAGAVVIASVADPGEWWRLVLLVALAVLVCVDQSWLLPVPLVSSVLVLGMLTVRWAGDLEPGMFLLSVFAVLLTSSRTFDWRVGVAVAGLLAVPIVLAAHGTPGTSAIWVLGIGTPAAMGWAGRRQVQLTEDLSEARAALAEQALVEERRRIARDVHDLVGHGLAAALVQITSARHVLRRDPDAADEALVVAEEAGRASLRDLRSTLARLRDGSEGVESLPGLADLPALVATSAEAGLDIHLRIGGDLATAGQAVGLTAYRICQEALTNALRHAPRARTDVEVDIAPDAVRVDVLSLGAAGADGAHGFGVLGMRERAEGVGGSLEAGPTDRGWLVAATLPAEPGR